MIVTRGRTIPVFFINEHNPYSARQIVLILKCANQEIGVIADEVDEVLTINITKGTNTNAISEIKNPFQIIGSVFDSVPIVSAG